MREGGVVVLSAARHGTPFVVLSATPFVVLSGAKDLHVRVLRSAQDDNEFAALRTTDHFDRSTIMQYRRFGRTGWQVSEIGYGMWGMAGWAGSGDGQSVEAMHVGLGPGCDLFD